MGNLFGYIKKTGLFMLGCIVVTVMIGLVNIRHSVVIADQFNIADSVIDVSEQWEGLLSIAHHWTEGNMTATVKWQGAWNTLLSPEEAVGVLSSRLGMTNVNLSDVQGHHVYSADREEGGIYSKLTVTPQETGQYYVILRLEASSPEQVHKLTELHLIYGESLIDEGVIARWNGALQGTAGQGTLPSPYTESSLSDAIEKFTAKGLNMELVENYNDFGTVSRTYEVKEWPVFVQSGGHKVSFQLGVHHNSEEDTYDISLGSPLLTIEY